MIVRVAPSRRSIVMVDAVLAVTSPKSVAGATWIAVAVNVSPLRVPTRWSRLPGTSAWSRVTVSRPSL